MRILTASSDKPFDIRHCPIWLIPTLGRLIREGGTITQVTLRHQGTPDAWAEVEMQMPIVGMVTRACWCTASKSGSKENPPLPVIYWNE